MDIIVKKFGGTSLASINHIKNIAKLIKKNYNANKERLIVVVSAMAQITDNLVSYYNDIAQDEIKENLREKDVLITNGEQMSSALLSIALNNIGLKSMSLQGWQIPIKTNNNYNNADIIEISTDKMMQFISNEYIIIISGFQGVTQEGFITSLGRGGSDTTALAIAASMKAKYCDIYSDVDGVYTSDPNVTKDAVKIELIDYKKMLLMSNMGAKILHPKSVEIAMKHNIPIRVKSSFIENEGTLVTNLSL